MLSHSGDKYFVYFLTVHLHSLRSWEMCPRTHIFIQCHNKREEETNHTIFISPALFQVSAHKIQNFSFYNDVSYVQCAPPTMKKRGADSWERNWVNVVNIVFMYYIHYALFHTKGNCLQTVLLVNVKFSLSLCLVKTYFNC